ncbi:MAG: DNA repair protein RecO [Marinilabiliaceae bacterium]|nr:DNA repair protein RecO [Marinilabiliaceae bacterium]
MLYKTDGIVLDHTLFGETSAIIHVFTREFGTKSYMVNGILGTKKRDKIILLHPLNILELEVYNKENSEIQRIKEFKLKRQQEHIPFSQERRAQTFFLTDFLSNILRNENSNKPLYDFIYDAVLFLDSENVGIENYHLYFLFQMTFFLGFSPDAKNAAIYPFFDLNEGSFVSKEPIHNSFLDIDETKLFSRFFFIKLENLSQLAKNVNERKILLKTIVALYKFHFPNKLKLKSLDVLGQLF